MQVIIGPTATLNSIASYVDSVRGSRSDRPTYRSVHGRDSVEVRAADLTAGDLPRPAAAGAGRRPAAGGRPEPDRAAHRRQRLPRPVPLPGMAGTAFPHRRHADLPGPRPGRRRRPAADRGRLRCLGRRSTSDSWPIGTCGCWPATCRHPSSAWTQPVWDRLAGTVDQIVHSAALVNHVLPYSQLFEPNVLGTAELIRLALTTRRKRFSYVSTVAVAMRPDRSFLDETVDIRVASAVRPVDDSYANGYATSKWAGEVLLRRAHEQCGLPVAVFRPDMILAHSRYAGQLNLPDRFTRLLLSVVATGMAPGSFYALDAARQPAARALQRAAGGLHRGRHHQPRRAGDQRFRHLQRGERARRRCLAGPVRRLADRARASDHPDRRLPAVADPGSRSP